MQQRGKFIVFEGIDGSGKGTQLLRCAGFIFDMSKENDVYITREPTRDFKQLREEMKRGQEVHQNAEWYTQTFIKDRRNHVAHYILPALNRGTHVICDRYKHSTLVYQHAQGMRLEDLQTMHEGILVPDLTFIFDLDADIAFGRRKGAGATDVFDKDKEFLKVLRNNYKKLRDVLVDENVVYIDAARTREEVERDVQEHVQRLLGQ
jgi:dTMP kinase